MSEESPNSDNSRAALEIWVKRAQSLPPLTADEEKELWQRIVDGDQEAYNRIIEGHLRLVITMVMKQFPKGIKSLTPADHPNLVALIQAGHSGVIRAAGKFDPSLGYHFSTYASYWIRAAVRRTMAGHPQVEGAESVPPNLGELTERLYFNLATWVHSSGRLPTMYMTEHMVELSHSASRKLATLMHSMGRMPTIEEFAAELQSDTDIAELMLHYMPKTFSIDD